jgi:hypothetical protein
MDVYVYVCPGITLERLERFRPNLVHTLLYVCVVEVEVTLRLTISQSIYLDIEYPCGTCDQILFPVGMLLSEICGLVSIGRPL